MFNKKIDIIMPNYNKERFLSEAIESVIRQTYKNWKLYIIDDFSSDNSRKILKGYKKNKKIKVYLLNKNKGPAFCRNLGLKKSNARYIAFLDSDDFWKKTLSIPVANASLHLWNAIDMFFFLIFVSGFTEDFTTDSLFQNTLVGSSKGTPIILSLCLSAIIISLPV